jgi:hypothetical protein
MRDWVEAHCVTNTVPEADQIFIGHGMPNEITRTPAYANIIRYHKGVSLREIIDQTPFKDAEVLVIVMRPGPTPKYDPQHPEAGGFSVHLKPSDKPKSEIKPLDMIWIIDGTFII